MGTEMIEVSVDVEAARAYRSASREQQEKVQALLNAWLKGMDRGQTRPLKDVMDDVGRKARERGLTPDIVDDLLRDE